MRSGDSRKEARLERASALRLAACGILGLGAALIMAALLLCTYTVGKVSKIPLNIDARLISTGKGTALNMEKLNPPQPSPPPQPAPNGEKKPRDLVFVTDPNVDLEQQQQITTESGPEGQNNDDYVTLQVGTSLRRILAPTGAGEGQGDAGLLLAMIDTVTVNRKTGMAADTDGPNGWLAKPRDFRGTDKPVPVPLPHTGLTYRFPVNVEKGTSYEVFDPIAQKSFPAAYVDDADVLGLTTYHYVQEIGMNEKGELLAPENPGTYKQERYPSLFEPVPDPNDPEPVLEKKKKYRPDTIVTLEASQWGLTKGPPDKLVTMVRYYAAYHEFWVDPVSGTIVKQRDQTAHYFVPCADWTCDEHDPPAPKAGGQLPADAKILVKYDIHSTESTVEAQVSAARDQRDQIALWGRILPITIGALGVIALVGGALLGVFGARAETALIDPGLDQRDLDFFPRGPAGEPVPGAEAETEKLPTQRPLQRPIQAEPPPEQPPP